jgi:hypothetical protein
MSNCQSKLKQRTHTRSTELIDKFLKSYLKEKLHKRMFKILLKREKRVKRVKQHYTKKHLSGRALFFLYS